MLEVGLWQTMESLAPKYRDDPKRFRNHLLEIARRELPAQTGRIYASATKICLEISELGHTEEEGQKVLRQVIEDLSRCVI